MEPVKFLAKIKIAKTYSIAKLKGIIPKFKKTCKLKFFAANLDI
jgi:hypothetical protein